MRVRLPLSTLLLRLLFVLLAILSVLSCPSALGSGPRWVSGPPFFWNSGAPITWYTTSPQYFTDPGDLSATVNHAAADALVANAAAVWNIPTASLVLTQGGSLDQHVSSANVLTAPGGLTFPADVQAANYQTKQIAVIYDTDGSVTDLMLGAGASDPSGCRQAAVTESVDSFDPSAEILHAVLVLNGRCTGPDPDQQTQIQYQLMRAFGRVLGLSWSQTNDNVFTRTPVATQDQVANWPVMHPIDILCGPYTFKCMLQPFTLRPDDIASLAFLYPINQGQATGTKQDTLANAFTLDGFVSLGNGQGMEGVNVTVRRHHMFAYTVEGWQSVSGVSGYSFRQQTATPVAGPDGSPTGSLGDYTDWREGYFRMTGIQLADTDGWETVVLQTEPVNPLYTGLYAVAPYTGDTIAPSGAVTIQESQLAPRYGWNREWINPSGAASQCTATADGTMQTPAVAPSSGWWNGTVCGYAHAAWNSVAIRSGRTLTVEVTALDEQGQATLAKAMPVIGAWGSTDDLAGAPTMGSSPAAFNSLVAGLTRLSLSSTTAQTVQLAISDQRGAGRPDFGYQARVLYADTIIPSNVPATGGTVTITGMGFRPGVSVLVDGVAATVTSVAPNQIVATAPSLRALGATRPMVADVVVSDPATAGSSTMTAALGYASSAERLEVLSVPSGNVSVGLASSTPFAVQVVASDGVTPVAGESVTFAVTGGQATFGACGTSRCVLLTDGQGLATTTFTATAVGPLSLSVATPTVDLGPYRVVATVAPDSLRLISAPSGVQTTGVPSATPLSVKLTAADGVTPRAGEVVAFSATGTAVLFGACSGTVCNVTTDSTGTASTSISVLSPGTAWLTASAVTRSVSTSVSAAAPTMRIVSAPAGLLTIDTVSATSFAVQVLAGDGVSPIVGEAIAFMASGGGVRFAPCGAATCTVLSDTRGMASVSVTPTLTGPVTLSAAAREGSVTAGFVAGAEVLRMLTAPSGSVPVGTAAANAFSLQLLQADGVTPVGGAAVMFSVTAGPALLSNCNAATCTAQTDSQGRASVLITPTAAGQITVTASVAGSSQSASLLGVSLPNVLQIVSLPASTVFTGGTTAAFAVRVVTGDLRSGVAGQTVSLSATGGGSVLFVACGTPVCQLTTDNTGLATTMVTGLSAGTIEIVASASAGSVSTPLAVIARNRSITAQRPVLHIAEGTPFSWTTEVTVADESGSANNVFVAWSGQGALRFANTASTTLLSTASMPTAVEALGAGMVASGTACAWISICAPVAAVGVSGTEFQVNVLDGGGQSIAQDSSFAPIHLRVSDTVGHPVAGALVTVRQTVSSWAPACSDEGRCGASAVLAAYQQVLQADVDGVIAVSPAVISGTPAVTTVAASAGTMGFATVTVERLP